MNRLRKTVVWASIAAAVVFGIEWSLRAEPVRPIENPPVTAARFAFVVLTGTDAKYLGDTPSFEGRNGLKGLAPKLALGDPVFRDKHQIGTISSVTWDRGKDGLDIEFSPRPLENIYVGETVWVALDGSKASHEN